MKPYSEEDKIGTAYVHLIVYALLGEMSHFQGSPSWYRAMESWLLGGEAGRGGPIDRQRIASAVIVERYPYLRHSCRMYPEGTVETVVISGLLRNGLVV